MAFLKKTKKLHGTAVREQRRPNRLGNLHEEVLVLEPAAC